MRVTEKVPTRPDAKVAVKDAVSSFSTSPTSSETGAALCPTTAPSGSGRLVICVERTAPETDTMGPATYSAASMTCEPMSPSAPEPAPPLKRQLSGPRGSVA